MQRVNYGKNCIKRKNAIVFGPTNTELYYLIFLPCLPKLIEPSKDKKQFKWYNWDIIEVDKCPCINFEEVLKKERYYIETLNYMDGVKMKNVGIYTNECFYINQLPTQLLKDIIVYFYKTYELPITTPLKTSHDKLILNKYYSTEYPHAFKLKTSLTI